MGVTNLKYSELQEVIDAFNFEPGYNRMIVTLNRIEDLDGIITTEDALADTQWVVAAGSRAQYKAGDKVMLDLQKLTIQEQSPSDKTQYVERIKITPFMFGGRVYTLITDNDIVGKFTGEEDVIADVANLEVVGELVTDDLPDGAKGKTVV